MRYIRITEKDLYRIVENTYRRVIEGAWDKYQDDLMNIEMDNLQNDMGMARAYSQMNDPMIKSVKGSTVRDMLSPEVGNKLDDNSGNYEDYCQDKITDDWLNTPNSSKNFDKFPRYSRTDSGLKNYDNLRNGSSRIRKYKNGSQV